MTRGVAATALAFAMVTGTLGVHLLSAQQSALKRTVLQKQDLSAPGREAVMAMAELPPDAVAARHTHPGEEMGYVLEGTAVLEVDGKPPVTLKAGEIFFIEAGIPHSARNIGATTAKVLGVYIVEKGKPLASPAP
jgi:quercetin dioxygenase-like cupin family protein